MLKTNSGNEVNNRMPLTSFSEISALGLSNTTARHRSPNFKAKFPVIIVPRECPINTTLRPSAIWSITFRTRLARASVVNWSHPASKRGDCPHPGRSRARTSATCPKYFNNGSNWLICPPSPWIKTINGVGRGNFDTSEWGAWKIRRWCVSTSINEVYDLIYSESSTR